MVISDEGCLVGRLRRGAHFQPQMPGPLVSRLRAAIANAASPIGCGINAHRRLDQPPALAHLRGVQVRAERPATARVNLAPGPVLGVSSSIRKAATRRVFAFGEVRGIPRADQGSGHGGRFPGHLGQGSPFANGCGQPGQAARALARRPLVACCTPSTNVMPARTSGRRCAPSSRRHRACAMSRSL